MLYTVSSCSHKGTQLPGKMLCSNQKGKRSLRMDSEDSKTGYLMSFQLYFCLFEIVLSEQTMSVEQVPRQNANIRTLEERDYIFKCLSMRLKQQSFAFPEALHNITVILRITKFNNNLYIQFRKGLIMCHLQLSN